MEVAKHPAAHPQDHRPVPAHQRLEGGFVLPGEEALQQLPIRHPAAVVEKRGSAKETDDPAHLTSRHVASSAPWHLLSPLNTEGNKARASICFATIYEGSSYSVEVAG